MEVEREDGGKKVMQIKQTGRFTSCFGFYVGVAISAAAANIGAVRCCIAPVL